MSYPKNGASKYKTTSIESASKEMILIMLYEGAIRNIKLGIKATEEKRIADKGLYLGKAHDIVSELMNSLDHRVGGNLSKDLETLYIYIIDKITEGNIKNDVECFNSVITVLNTLLDGWKDALDSLKKERSEKLKVSKL